MSRNAQPRTPDTRLRRASAPHPRQFGATRFFARILAADLECPRCGRIFRIRPQGGSRLTAQTFDNEHSWNPSTQRLTCKGSRGCQKSYRLGILAWDPPRGSGANAPAEDTVPSPRDLAQLRAEGDGWWMPDGSQGTGRMDMTNLAATDERPERDEDDEDY